jgi:hypothetical protein
VAKRSNCILALVVGLLWSAGFPVLAQGGVAADGLSLRADCGVLSVTPIAEGALRVRCSPTADVKPSSIVLIHPAANVPFKIRRDAGTVSLATSKLRATYEKDSGVLRFSDATGHVLLEEGPGGRQVQASTVQASFVDVPS